MDCITDLASYSDYAKLEETLRSKGFKNSMNHGDPICRWVVNDVTVDVMPTDASVIGFSNRWYKEGIEQAIEVSLPSGVSIKIFSPPYFVASKFEAFLGRGQGDFRTSHDIEDVVTLLDGLLSFESFEQIPKDIEQYLREKFSEFLNDSLFEESISGHIEPGPSHPERTKRVLKFFEDFSK